MELYCTIRKGRGQVRVEKPPRTVDTHLRRGLCEDGSKAIPLPLLRNYSKGVIAGRKIHGVYPKPFLQAVHLATAGRLEGERFRDKKAEWRAAVRGKLRVGVVREREVGAAREGVGFSVKHAVNR